METIGDAYMCVATNQEGGRTLDASKYAERVCSVALLVQQRCSGLKFRGRELRLRMGVHSGSCVSGIVGSVMPRYCFFGNTINIANRLENSGEVGRIHLSTDTAELLRELGNPAFVLTEREGRVQLKGVKEPVTTFWLSRSAAPEVWAH